MTLRIECINKTPRNDTHLRISHVGGRNGDGTRWRLSQPDAVEGAQGGKYSFYVERPAGHRVAVIVARSQYGHLYLKTEADGEQPDNLLSLDECPL
jgi:hypothetical protein